MSLSNQSPEPTDSSIRPSSVWTNDSAFADSAISMGSRTPKLPEETSLDVQSPQPTGPSIADRLNHLASAVWAAEDELPLKSARRKRIQKAIRTIEECLDDTEAPGEEEDEELANKQSLESKNEANPTNEVLLQSTLAELEEVHQRLRSTVESMRWRLEEQRHLNQLAVSKLGSVAQTNLVQEAKIQDIEQGVLNLRTENEQLGQENDDLNQKIANLESEATRKDVAVNAMSSAVAGLEGWVNNSPSSGLYGQDAGPSRQKRGKYVVRGRGRFRARYYIDEGESEPTGLMVEGTSSEARELYDGVKGWLRGFRDVEEELRRKATIERRISADVESGYNQTDEDFGDFETVSETQ